MKYIAFVKRNGVFESQDALRITEVTETRVRGQMDWDNGSGRFSNFDVARKPNNTFFKSYPSGHDVYMFKEVKEDLAVWLDKIG